MPAKIRNLEQKQELPKCPKCGKQLIEGDVESGIVYFNKLKNLSVDVKAKISCSSCGYPIFPDSIEEIERYLEMSRMLGISFECFRVLCKPIALSHSKIVKDHNRKTFDICCRLDDRIKQAIQIKDSLELEHIAKEFEKTVDMEKIYQIFDKYIFEEEE